MLKLSLASQVNKVQASRVPGQVLPKPEWCLKTALEPGLGGDGSAGARWGSEVQGEAWNGIPESI